MPEMTDFATLLFERRDGAAFVTLNRPQSRNAMSLEMVRELIAALDEAQQTGARMVVLQGAGGHFCSGGDIKDMSAPPPGGGETDPIIEVSTRFGQMCAIYGASDLPIVAVVEGAVMGGGFGLACVADATIARETAVFRLPETSLGLVPAQIEPFLLERLGYSQAKRLSVTGGEVTAQEALEIGLVHFLCDGVQETEARLIQVMQDIRKCAPNAVAATKRLLRKGRNAEPADLIGHAAEVFTAAVRSDEGAEGMTAFIEKRPAKWAVSE